jgi:hypothetical protein
MPDQDRQQFIILPKRGIRAETGPALDLLLRLQAGFRGGDFSMDSTGGRIAVVDSVQENGAKLVETDAETIAAINRPDSPLRAFPLVEYPKPNPWPELQALVPAAAGCAPA